MPNEFACVRLGDEQVMVELDKLGQPTAKFALRIKDATGRARRLSRDEELVLAAAPSTKADSNGQTSRTRRKARRQDGIGQKRAVHGWKLRGCSTARSA